MVKKCPNFGLILVVAIPIGGTVLFRTPNLSPNFQIYSERLHVFSQMNDENEPPLSDGNVANEDVPRIRITLGPNPVVKAKKSYFPWTADQKLYFVKCVKHRNAHMPKLKGQIPVAQAWELVLLNLGNDSRKRFADLGMTDNKALQNTYNRFAKDVRTQYGVEKDAINLSGLLAKDPYGSLVLEMEEERFSRCGERKDKTEQGKKKRKLLGAMAGTVLNAQGRTQDTPAARVSLEIAEAAAPVIPPSAPPISTPSPLSSEVPSAGGASAFITKLAGEIKASLGGDSGLNHEIKLAQLEAARAQAEYYKSMTRPRFEAPSGTGSLYSSDPSYYSSGPGSSSSSSSSSNHRGIAEYQE